MFRRFALPLVLVAASVAFSSKAGAQAPAAIKWRHDYNQARREAKEKNLPVFVDCFTTWCGPCKKLEETTFRDPKVVELLNEKFIPLKVDGEKESELARGMNVQGFPTLVMADPDGKILRVVSGYQEVPQLLELLHRAVGSTTTPEWMLQDYQRAVKLVGSQEYARAIAALKNVLDASGGRPVQEQAQKLLAEIEQKAAERIGQAKQLHEQGQSPQAVQALTEAIRDFPGLRVTREASELMTRIVQSPEIRNQQRSRRAQELLAQARDYYKTKDYFLSLDRCDQLLSGYGDLPEGQEAHQLAGEIKNNPEVLQSACDNLSDRLSNLYLSLADAFLKKGQRQQAMTYLQRVIAAFPGTRQAESAQIRLSQLQGTSTLRVDFQRPLGQ